MKRKRRAQQEKNTTNINTQCPNYAVSAGINRRAALIGAAAGIFCTAGCSRANNEYGELMNDLNPVVLLLWECENTHLRL